MTWKPIVDLATFHSAVALGKTHETRHLEFKSGYGWRKASAPDAAADQAEELSRDVAQFANTDGGTLLVGVRERRTEDGRSVADAITHLEEVDGFKQWVEQAIRKHLTPSTFSRSVDPVLLPSGTIVAINIPSSLHLVALWHADRKRGIEYLYRTDHGKEWMNPDEVERHIMNGTRATQLALKSVLEEAGRTSSGNPRVELTPSIKPWVVIQGMETIVSPVQAWVDRRATTDRTLELRANVDGRVRSIRVPIGLISEVWTTAEGNVGLCLKVAVTVVGDGDLALEPLVFVS